MEAQAQGPSLRGKEIAARSCAQTYQEPDNLHTSQPSILDFEPLYPK